MLRQLSVRVVIPVLGTLALMPVTAHASLREGHPEWFNNLILLNTTHQGVVAVGSIKLSSAALEAEVECASVLFGGIWNEGSPRVGHAQVLGSLTQGDATTTGSALSPECKFKQGTATGDAWVADELPLSQSGTVGARTEPLTVPWNGQLRCGEREEEAAFILETGTPTGAATATGCETEEVEVVEVKNEEEEHKGCYASPVPAGCVKITIVQPALALEALFEGTLRPRFSNGFGSGLNASRLRFEGPLSGQLRLSGASATALTVVGSERFSGFNASELITAK